MCLKVFQFWARGPPASQENDPTCEACELCCLNAHASGVCFVTGICCVVWPILEGHENDVSGEVGGCQHLKVCDPCIHMHHPFGCSVCVCQMFPHFHLIVKNG